MSKPRTVSVEEAEARTRREMAALPPDADAVVITNGPRRGHIIQIGTRPRCPGCGKQVQFWPNGRPRPHAVPREKRKDPRRGEACPGGRA